MNLSCLNAGLITLALSIGAPNLLAQGAPVVNAAKGIAKVLFKKGADLASEQAIKTATETAVQAGMSMPVEDYDLSHSFQYYSEQSWGIYRVVLPWRDLTVWVDPAGTTKYLLKIDNKEVSTEPVYFPEATRNYRCVITPGLFEFNLVSSLTYRGRCNVITPNIVHAVNQHNAKIFVAGASLQSNCDPAPISWKYETISKSVGRSSYADFRLTVKNFQVDYQYISYE